MKLLLALSLLQQVGSQGPDGGKNDNEPSVICPILLFFKCHGSISMNNVFVRALQFPFALPLHSSLSTSSTICLLNPATIDTQKNHCDVKSSSGQGGMCLQGVE